MRAATIAADHAKRQASPETIPASRGTRLVSVPGSSHCRRHLPELRGARLGALRSPGCSRTNFITSCQPNSSTLPKKRSVPRSLTSAVSQRIAEQQCEVWRRRLRDWFSGPGQPTEARACPTRQNFRRSATLRYIGRPGCNIPVRRTAARRLCGSAPAKCFGQKHPVLWGRVELTQFPPTLSAGSGTPGDF